MWLIFPFIIAPKSENHFNWNVLISQGRKITVHLPKSCQLWFPSVRFRFFHSANIHIANIVPHCSNTGEKIAKCNSIILWWRKKYFLSYMSSEFLVVFNFFSTRTVVCDSFQMELYLQSFKSLFCFVFVLLDFATYVWCCCLQWCYVEKRNFEMSNEIQIGLSMHLEVFFIDSKVIGPGKI